MSCEHEFGHSDFPFMNLSQILHRSLSPLMCHGRPDKGQPTAMASSFVPLAEAITPVQMELQRTAERSETACLGSPRAGSLLRAASG